MNISKQTLPWGSVPEEWKIAKLVDLAWFQEGPGVRNNQFTDRGVKLLNGSNISSGKLRLENTTRHISDIEAYGRYAHFLVDPGDIVIASSGITIDRFDEKVAIASSEDLPLCMNTSTIRFKIVDDKLDKGYFIYFLTSAFFKRQIAGEATGSAQLNFGPTHLANVEIPLPSLDQQQAIAGALADLDAFASELSELLKKKSGLRTAMMERLLTGKVRLPGFSKPWRIRRLGDHVNFLKNGTHSRAQLTQEDPVRYLHYGDIHRSTEDILDLGTVDLPRLSSVEALRLPRLADGDLVFVDASEDLDGVGKSLEIRSLEAKELVAGQHSIAARFDKAVLADGFKAYLQHIPCFKRHLRRLAAGTKVYATNRKQIESAEITLPEVDEQRAIASVLDDMAAELGALKCRIDKTCSLKQAMMQALLTGRVHLPVDSTAGAAKEMTYG
ncbi:restriction endonuclease subunit S [Qipengyuania aquimaris]|uniref:restriction endonuclease subunit S n=1 Tax=Qipengyuania aquimaris TaxID=255984 RepID=UPI001C978776|nr:restriction endonuclease subunit S [Qipengyuania aquimaris]MBY6127687.1 restriction endonuclease subunit S [Qipengyuania aquimaris]